MIIFLKLGGSLITDKKKPRKHKPEMIYRLVSELAQARRDLPQLKIIFGHGSGSFGHVPAKEYGTRDGVHTPQQWSGFIQVWRQARALNQILLDALADENIPAIAFPPSAFIQSRNGRLESWNPQPIHAALSAGLVPVVNGDVVFDSIRGGTIYSTEDVFVSLTEIITPDQILLCGLEEGVWADFPQCTHLLSSISIDQAGQILPKLGGSSGIDVTGGMTEKVRLMLDLAVRHPTLKCMIFSGQEPGNLYRALMGDHIGTMIAN